MCAWSAEGVAPQLTLISQSRKDFCQIFARVLHVVAFGKSFPNTFCTFCELLLFFSAACVRYNFCFSQTSPCRAPFSLTQQIHSLTHTLKLALCTGRRTAGKLRDCLSSTAAHKNKNINFVEFSLVYFCFACVCVCVCAFFVAYFCAIWQIPEKSR